MSVLSIIGIHPFIITLGTQAIFRGVTMIFSNARPVFGFPQTFKEGVAGWLWKIPIPVLIALVLALVMVYFTKKTKVARNLYALGGSKQAAWFWE